MALPFPTIDPILIEIGPLAIRWYALAYVFGLLGAWALARHWASKLAPLHLGAPHSDDFDDILVYAAVGVILGGRLAFVIFYNWPYYASNPGDILAVWKGGMSFHGGLFGAAMALWFYAKKNTKSALTLLDIAASVAPIGLCLGRLANFINAELWGRQTDVPWAFIFPGTDGTPRHPSQLYEAMLEGAVLFIILQFIGAKGGFKKPGLIMGCFGFGYATFRIFCEFFRQPDVQLGFLWGGLTMGMVLSIPMAILGCYFMFKAVNPSK